MSVEKENEKKNKKKKDRGRERAREGAREMQRIQAKRGKEKIEREKTHREILRERKRGIDRTSAEKKEDIDGSEKLQHASSAPQFFLFCCCL